jgi:chaperonin GroES
MHPIRDNVLLKPFPGDEISEGGILVPESVREISNKMTVIAVGSGTKESPMQFKAGDVVFRVKDSGKEGEVYIGGEIHFIMPQSYLLAKLN